MLDAVNIFKTTLEPRQFAAKFSVGPFIAAFGAFYMCLFIALLGPIGTLWFFLITFVPKIISQLLSNSYLIFVLLPIVYLILNKKAKYIPNRVYSFNEIFDQKGGRLLVYAVFSSLICSLLGIILAMNLACKLLPGPSFILEIFCTP